MSQTYQRQRIVPHVTRRALTQDEAHVLSEETRKSPHIGFIGSDLWHRFPHVWVATVNESFVGVCAVFPLKKWVKLGPLLVLEQYQGNGYGKHLLTHVAHQYRNTRLFVGSSNPKVHTIIGSLGFSEAANVWHVPFEVQRYLVRYMFMRASYVYLLDALRKNLLFRRGEYRYFLKT